MFSFIKKLFGSQRPDLAAMLQEGAVVVDVRTPGEFAGGHVKGSVNIPLDRIGNKINELKKHSQIIVCCRSGNRSGQAKRILEAAGFTNVVNGGSWMNVKAHKK